MRTGSLVLALTMSGALGGLCGALLVQGTAPDAPPAAATAGASPASRPPDESREKAMVDLGHRVEVLEANLGNVVTESGRLRDELAAERKIGGEARERLATLEKNPATGIPGLPDGVSPGLRQVELGNVMPLLRGMGEGAGLAERFRKIGELRALSVDDRWQKAREALGLTSTQEEELKAALKERDESMKDAMKVTTSETKVSDGNSNPTLTFAVPDMEKMRDSRKHYEDRVAQSLNADQAKRWKDDGYEGSLGGGSGAVIATAIRVDSQGAEAK